MITCPRCKNTDGCRVLYAGLPMKLCQSKGCNTVWGFWSWIPTHLGFDGYFLFYKGSYLKAWWQWVWSEPGSET